MIVFPMYVPGSMSVPFERKTSTVISPGPSGVNGWLNWGKAVGLVCFFFPFPQEVLELVLLPLT